MTLALIGDDAGAEVELRAAHDLWTSIAPTDPELFRARAELAMLTYRRGELDEAEALVAAARRSPTDDLECRIRWRIAAAHVEAGRGRMEHAVGLADEAVQLASGTDWLDLRAEALETLALVGGPPSARNEGLELATLRGNVVLAARIAELPH